MAVVDNSAAQYRYFVTNLVTNEILAEIPFKGVSYERVLTGAGTFSANIVSSPETASLSLYESTMPGRTGIYAVRDGVCVWGGIIWSRSYNVNERVIQISASEFTSYFHHRRIWKTWGQEFSGNLEVKGDLIKVTLPFGSSYELAPNSTVRLSFLEENAIYTGTYTVLAGGTEVGSELVPPITKDVFHVSNPGVSGETTLGKIPNGNYSSVTVTLRTNTYDYVRSLINAMSDDFSGVEFANDEIQPAKIITENVVVKRILNGVATLQTPEGSSVVPGQAIEVRNVDPLIDGTRVVSSVIDNLITINRVGGVIPATAIDNNKYTVTSRKAVKINSQSSLVTVTTEEPHKIVKNSFVNISSLDLPDAPTKALNVKEKLIEDEPEDSNTFSYTVNRSLEMMPIKLSKPLAAVNSVGKIISRRQVETIDNKKVATITTLESNDFQIGETVTISGLKDYSTITKYKVNTGISDTPVSTDYYTPVKPPLHYNPVAPQLVDDGEGGFISIDNPTPPSVVNISGFARTTNIISRSMSYVEPTATFTVTTSTPHGLGIGSTVTVSGLQDSYRIRSYSFSTLNNIATFFTGTQNVASNHNIRASSEFGRFTVSGLGSVQRFSVTSLKQEGAGALTIITNTASNLISGTKVELSGVDRDASRTFTVKNINRQNNVTTITTNVAHNLNVGDIFTYAGTNSTTNTAAGTFTVKGVSEDKTKFFYDNPVTPTRDITASVTLKCTESWTWENDSTSGRGRRITGGGNVFTALNTMYQGNPQDGFGYEVGAARFENLASRLPEGITLSNLTSITSLKTKLRRAPRVGANRNTTLYLGLHGSSNLATSTPPVGITGATAPDSTGWAIGGTRTINLPPDWRQFFLSGDAKGLIIGLENPPVSYYTGIPEYMGIFGKGSGDANEPTLILNYVYRSSNIADTAGNNLGTVTAPFYGYDGTYTLHEDSVGTSIKLYSADGKITDEFINVSGNVSVSSLLNKTYSGDEIISKTANSITVQAPPLGIDVSAGEIIVDGSQKITESSIFNVSDETPAIALSDTQFRYTKTETYNVDVVAETVFPVGKATTPDSRLNVTGRNVIDKVVLEDGLYRIRVEDDLFGAPIIDIKNTVVAESDSYLNGDYQIISKLSDNSFQFEILEEFDEHESIPTYGYSTASNNATISYGSFGSFTASSDLGFDFSTTGNSDKNVLPTSFRGFRLLNIGEELEKYTDRLEGFDYRVDCYISPADNSFKRQFVMVPVFPPAVEEYIEAQDGGKLALGESVPIKYFGADKLVFEFPGNISDLQLEESAENAVTRFFMVGNIGDLGEDASQPYAASADTELLSPSTNSYPWPLLDDDDSDNDISEEEELYSYAERYMDENKPPAGNFAVSVNGSVEPVIGSYAPGDWCSLIINDEFIKQRLSSELEPRNNILLRKINSYSVEVPDSVTFPEKITLQLLPEWQVDKRGK
jgi:hypothetical protein